MKILSSAERVKEIAQLVADNSKRAAGMSRVFHLVVICARILSMYEEANRGCRVLPAALYQILISLQE